MFKIGETVMHPSSGVCSVSEITTRNITPREKRDYYVLKPVYKEENTTIFLPVDCNKVGVRRILPPDRIDQIISLVDLKSKLWVDNDNIRKESFHEILKSGNHEKIIQLIAELHQHKEKREAAGKNLRISDAKILKEAEKIIHEEFAYALNIPLEDTADFIMKKLGLEIKKTEE